jgi:hypothetical protein
MRRSSMRIRKLLVACFAALLAGVGLAIPTTAAASIPVTCGTQTGGSGGPNFVKAVRVGHHTEEGGFDRFVVEFQDVPSPKLPTWTATPKSSAVFYSTGTGPVHQIPLEGTAGIKLSLFSSSLHDPVVSPTHFDPGFPQLAEVQDLGGTEGHVDFGLGLKRQSCKRIFTLTSPTRLVIDVPN